MGILRGSKERRGWNGSRLVRETTSRPIFPSPSLVLPIEQLHTRTSNNNRARAVHRELLARGIVHRKGHQGKEDAPKGKGEEAALHFLFVPVDLMMMAGGVEGGRRGMSMGPGADGATASTRAVRC